MGYQLSIDVQAVFLDRGAQGWNIDRYVNDAEEGKCKHSRYSAGQSWSVYASKF